jgi:hypothetical protein
MLPWLLGRCSLQLRKSHACANMVFPRTERVFILKHFSHRNCLLLFMKHLAMLSLKIGVWWAVSWRWIVGPLFFWGENAERYQNILTQLSSLLEEIKQIVGFKIMGQRPTLRTQLPYCKSYLMSVLLGVAFGHRDLQTLTRQTSSCRSVSKKEVIRITHEVWRKWNLILNRLLPTLTQKHFAKSHGTHWKGWMLVFEKVVDIFSICHKAVL